MKTITLYSLSSQLGHSLDLDDVLDAIVVSPNDGGIQFNEGDNGLNGVYMSSKVIKGFQINAKLHLLILTFSRDEGDEKYLIGKIAKNDLGFAYDWMENVNKIYSSRLRVPVVKKTTRKEIKVTTGRRIMGGRVMSVSNSVKLVKSAVPGEDLLVSKMQGRASKRDNQRGVVVRLRGNIYKEQLQKIGYRNEGSGEETVNLIQYEHSGGSEGQAKGYHSPVMPTGKPTKGTSRRERCKPSNKAILRRGKTKRH